MEGLGPFGFTNGPNNMEQYDVRCMMYGTYILNTWWWHLVFVIYLVADLRLSWRLVVAVNYLNLENV